jgi:polyvinyl alcohol dehydrogenase (cytochrome)
MGRTGFGTFRRRLAVSVLAVTLTLAAAGCSGASSSGPSTTQPVATVPPSTSSPASSAPTTTVSRTPSPSLGDLTTYDYGNARSGRDTVDPPISDLSAAPIWDDPLDGAVYGQPLVYDGMVYVATENDTIYGLGAKNGIVIWRLHVGTAVSTSVIDSAPTLSGGCGDITPLGITGTPVIDTAAGEIFAAEETEVGGDEWQDIQHWLVAVSLVTHEEVWHRQIDPPGGNDASHYYIPAEQQRPALTLFGGRVYVAFGGLDGDCGQYHGYVVDLPVSGRGALVSYQVPTQREGGIWGTGGAFVSAGGDLYVATGNGSSNQISDYDEGNSVVELSPALQRLGYWAPANWVQLNDADWDLGSAGPVAVPGTSLLFVVGKPADNGNFGYLMADSPLGGIGHGAYTGSVCPGGGAYGADSSDVIGTGDNARIYMYVPCGSGTEAVEINATPPISFRRAWSSSTGSPNGSPIVAGGRVWSLDWNSGQLFGMNPSSGQVTVVRSTGGLGHFVAPAVGDDLLFVPTLGGVEAFGTSGAG